MQYLLLALLLSASLAKAQIVRYYDGTIGPYPVIMEVNITHEGYVGAYFYKSQKKDIYFKQVSSTPDIILKTRNSWGDVIAKKEETFILKLSPDESLTGSWLSPKGNKLPVSLHTIDPNKINHPYAKYAGTTDLLKEEPIDYIRASSIQIIKDSIVKKGGLTLQYIHADHSPVYIPTIVDGVPPNIADQLNNILLERFMVSASRSYPCYLEYRVQDIFVCKNILSLHFNESGYCTGAAHPSENEYGITLNLQTGKQLKLQDLLRFPGLPPAPPESSDDWATYRSEKYGPQLMKLLKQLFPAQMKENTNCGYSQSERWNYAEWYLSETGLRLLPSFPHAAAICNSPKWSTIPYKTLRKFVDPAAKIELPTQ